MSFLEEADKQNRRQGYGFLAYPVGWVVAHFLGVNLFLPAMFALVFYLGILNLRPQATSHVRSACALVTGQTLWIVLGVMALVSQRVPASFMVVLPDVVISFGILAWLLISYSRVAAVLLIVFECVALAANTILLVRQPGWNPQASALIIHILVRISVVILMGLALKEGLRSHPDRDEEMEEIFA